MDRNYDVITIISNTFILRRPRVADFADTKIETMSIKKILINLNWKDSNELKRVRDYVLKYHLYL